MLKHFPGKSAAREVRAAELGDQWKKCRVPVK